MRFFTVLFMIGSIVAAPAVLFAQDIGRELLFETQPVPSAPDDLPFETLPLFSPPTDSAVPPPPRIEEAIIRLDARLTAGGAPLRDGVVWRIFDPKLDFNNKLPLLAEKEGGSAEFRLGPGKYLVHVAFGQAEMTRPIDVEAGKSHYETMILDAGGIALDAAIAGGGGETTINKDRIKFSIQPTDASGAEQAPIVQGVSPGAIVRLKAGLYHVTSTYGTVNAIVSANIRVDAGKLTEAVMEHHAAQVTLKLVRERGGEALADTSWAIMNASGDTIREMANAYVYLVLAEGDYIAYARNKEQNYQQEFTVIAGHDMEIDVLTALQNGH